PSVTVRQLIGQLSRRPAADGTARQEANAHRLRIARTAIEIALLFILFSLLAARFQGTGLASGVYEVQRVVNDSRIARLDLVSDDVLLLGQSARQHEAAEHVTTAGTDDEIGLCFENQIGLAEHPAIGELLRLGRVLGIALRCAAVGPTRQRADLLVGEL